MTARKILIDAREFVEGKLTGIARVLEGLAIALAETDVVGEIQLGASDLASLPIKLKDHTKMIVVRLPFSFLKSERALSNLTRNNIDLFVSPYPKLPLFGCYAKAAHIIHDILDLTHPAYKKRFRVIFDGWRLKSALKRADLTWYDSRWSLGQTRVYAGHVGKNPRVRYPGIDEKFASDRDEKDLSVWNRYGLKQGYLLALGNGLPHKNLGVLFEIADQLPRQIVLAGVSKNNQMHWEARYPATSAAWIHCVPDEDLPSLLRGAFCLAQPSTAEGYGYPPLEAMACGIPAVISDIPVLKETTGGNAIAAQAGAPKEWLGSLRALENEAFYRDQVERGLRWVDSIRGQKAWLSYIADVEEVLNMT